MNNTPDQARFFRLLHGGLSGRVAVLQSKRTSWTTLPETPKVSLGPANQWVSLASFTKVEKRGANGRVIYSREAQDARLCKAVWLDVDSPNHEFNASWKADTLAAIKAFSPAPTMVVDSGGGFHVYWILDKPSRIGFASEALKIWGCNNALEKAFKAVGADSVNDFARCLRIPDTWNCRASYGSRRRCSLISADGPQYDIASLVRLLKVDLTRVRAPSKPKPQSRQAPAPAQAQLLAPTKPIKRGRGRPSYGITLRDLRCLPKIIRELIVGGVWSHAKRFQKTSSAPDRSRADMAVVGVLVSKGWTDDRILLVFNRPDWKIGAKYRERGEKYLQRTIGKARSNNDIRAAGVSRKVGSK